MIKITPTTIPDILQVNQLNWTATLLNTIKYYGSYSAIPENIKNKVVNSYRDEDIKKAVKDITKSKCVFCESSIEIVDYTNIEHFYPKSIHPKFTFKWSNLLPSCRRCNIPKDDFDTKSNPFINPVLHEPKNFLFYQNLKVHPLNGSLEAINTIKHCELNRTELMRTRGQLLVSFYEMENKLEESNKAYNILSQKSAKIKHSNNLLQSILNLDNLSNYYSSYAGFFRYFITSSVAIKDSINIINENFSELGLQQKFSFEWS